jgi:hypothetical protein
VDRAGSSRRRHAPLLAAALAAVSCGGRAPDFYVQDTGVFVESAAPFARRPELAARVESTVGAALAYWGGDWSALAGRTITLSSDPYVTCNGSASALGCYDGDLRITTSDPGIGTFRCVEQTVLVHEIGHAVLGDALHADPRWMQLDPVAAALAGRVGWTAEGETDCPISVSVWRHPLGTR